jgi:NADPH-dependent curcumin reductase CurA
VASTKNCISSFHIIFVGRNRTNGSDTTMMKVLSLILLPTLASSFAGLSTMSVQQLTVGKGKTNVIAGATGYIGKSVVRESVRQGYKTIALVRDKSKVESADGKLMYGGYFDGAELVECDVCNPSNVEQVRVH